MMNKLNPIAAAAATTVAATSLAEQIREAALRLPIKHAMLELAVKLQQDLDAALHEAAERFLGHALADPEELRGRLEVTQTQGEEGETYRIDTVPILWAGPIGLSREGDEMRGGRVLKHLLAEPSRIVLP